MSPPSATYASKRSPSTCKPADFSAVARHGSSFKMNPASHLACTPCLMSFSCSLALVELPAHAVSASNFLRNPRKKLLRALFAFLESSFDIDASDGSGTGECRRRDTVGWLAAGRGGTSLAQRCRHVMRYISTYSYLYLQYESSFVYYCTKYHTICTRKRAPKTLVYTYVYVYVHQLCHRNGPGFVTSNTGI